MLPTTDLAGFDAMLRFNCKYVHINILDGKVGESQIYPKSENHFIQHIHIIKSIKIDPTIAVKHPLLHKLQTSLGQNHN